MDPLDRLSDAVARRAEADAAALAARQHLYAVIREIAPQVKQVDIVKRTGYTREHVRQIAQGT
jgi:predicted metal-dependent hydrolase